jgi:signal peptidase I
LLKSFSKGECSLKSHHDFKPAILKIKEDELFVSGSALVDLLRSVIDKGFLFRFRARGDSMVPFIMHDDLVTIAPLKNSLPHTGDVVAFSFQRPDKLIIHRIVKRKGDYFLLKGDNLSYIDGLIHKSNIIGYVTKIERKGKQVLLGLGIEKYIIAVLTRSGSVYQLILPFWRFIRPFIRRFKLRI